MLSLVLAAPFGHARVFNSEVDKGKGTAGGDEGWGKIDKARY